MVPLGPAMMAKKSRSLTGPAFIEIDVNQACSRVEKKYAPSMAAFSSLSEP
jgi:hypothetical protein